MMLAARELNVEKLPESSRNWINEKLIYTHGYGVTMNPVNGFTSEGLPTLILSNMPVQSTVPSLTVTRPEIYFGELTNTDVYVRTRQKEFNYPQGETNNLTSYEGNGGIPIGGFLRRLLIAISTGRSRQASLQRRRHGGEPPADAPQHPRSRRRAGAVHHLRSGSVHRRRRRRPPVVADRRLHHVGKLSVRRGTTGSGAIASTTCGTASRWSIDAYDGTTTFYVFDNEDPIIAAYRGIFPTLFKDAAAMPPSLRKHVRYPELMLKLQASVYGLYHMTDPEVFYNREDLWSVASEVGDQRGAGRADDGAELRADDAARVRRRPNSSRSCRSRRRTATTSSAGLPGAATIRTTAVRSFTIFRKRSSSTDRCRSRRGSIRTRSSPVSCRCGISRVRTCAAAA